MKKHLYFFASFLVASSIQAKIVLDLEPDPIPLVDLTVVLPVGFESTDSSEAGIAQLLPDLLESGAGNLGRQEFFDELGTFGADYDFSVSNQYSYIKLSFPLVAGTDYAPLIKLLRDNRFNPRFSDENFKKAKFKIRAALLNGLESDSALASTTIRRYINKKYLGGNPLFLDKLDKITLLQTKAFYEKAYLRPQQIWVGAVAPESAKTLIAKLVSAIFNDNEIVEERVPNLLPPTYQPNLKNFKNEKIALLIDKDNRAQNISSMLVLSPKSLASTREIPMNFGKHILVDSGLGSVFGEALRTRGGFSYAVGGAPSHYLGLPLVGFSTNPQANKIDAAMAVMRDLSLNSYERATEFMRLPSDDWKKQWQSFRYGVLLGRATAEGRLAERVAAVTGLISPSLVGADPAKWSTKREEVAEVFSTQWRDGLKLFTMVGDANLLKPLMERHFPDFRIVVMPYKDTIYSKAY